MKRWEDGAKGMLNVNAIFAGFSGAFLINIIGKDSAGSSINAGWYYASTILSIAALYWFARAAEWITDSLDEYQLDTYLRSMLAYNIGVVSLLFSLSSYLYFKNLPLFACGTALLSVWPWCKDICFLLLGLICSENKAYRIYKGKLDTDKKT